MSLSFRKNEQVRSPQVRLVGETGEHTGIVSIQEALQRARTAELDLIEISPTATPPVCKIADYGQFLYQKQREMQKAKAKQKKTDIKVLKVSLGIAQGDLQRQADKAREFLQEGHKVRFEMRLKGREKSKPELAKQRMQAIVGQLSDLGRLDSPVVLQMSVVSFSVTPKR
ncbi:MAG: translation initiation factor IF-3 [bacterium]